MKNAAILLSQAALLFALAAPHHPNHHDHSDQIGGEGGEVGGDIERLNAQAEGVNEAEQQRRQEYHGGLEAPKITQATAMKPRDADMFSVNMVRYPRERCAPARPEKRPHRAEARYFIFSGLLPAARRDSGCSPAARIQKPRGGL